MEFSAETRRLNLKEMKNEQLDVLIIGGGITGAGIALETSASMMKTGLLEMQDFAAGTSSRSTKLVHGGLRYLKQFEVEMVAEVSKERKIIHQNASHIVRPTEMLLPVYQEPGASFTLFSAQVALKLYDELANLEQGEQHTFLSSEEVQTLQSNLATEQLSGAGLYLDYSSDDARLTIEILKKAHEQGARVANYVKVTDFIYDEKEQVIGVLATDQLTNETYTIHASVVINATGPWSSMLEKEMILRPTKGIHLVVDQSRLNVNQPIYTDTGYQDNRMIFIIPRGGKTYLGTTDTDYEGDLSHPLVTKEEVDYLLHAVNRRFPEANLRLTDIEASWAGIRPLLASGDEDHPSAVSRGSSLFQTEKGLITIAGGKLTDYRRMAEETVKVIVQELERKTGKGYATVDTKNIRISGGELPQGGARGIFISEAIAKGGEVGLSESETRTLVDWYGSNIFQVLKGETFEGLSFIDSLSLRYALQHEMTLTPTDYFARRTDLLLFRVQHLKEVQEAVIAAMSHYYGWDEVEKERQGTGFRQVFEESQLTHLK
ncbi:FAD-dependent oxidoreductase [Jeotgalibaca caeni]|uniref:FAD-dependent oxidoreductase n=1 Tax=Jeotgalibaca caeni TaxID=3028623 RepID=UPI00237D67D5|nr:FAD-dependent oxidoreductase [Jeotgalibaca caeni]MDE1548784.1 FAD-dependent oxidoreductase [Jeotgalibaca caeni]